MKQKLYKNLNWTLKILCFGFFFGVGFLGFGSVKSASASCTYNITRFDTDSQTTLTDKDTANFVINFTETETVNNSSQINDCSKNAYPFNKITVQAPQLVNSYGAPLTSQAAGCDGYGCKPSCSKQGTNGNVTTYACQTTASMSLSGQTASVYSGISTLNFNLNIVGNVSPPASAATSWKVNFSYSGSTGSTPKGVSALNLTFSPVKSPYAAGDAVSVLAGLKTISDESGIGGWPSSVTNVRMETKLNGTTVGYNNVFNRKLLETQSITQQLGTVGTAPFQTGSNTIQVNFYDVASGATLASQSAVLQVGNGTPANPNAPSVSVVNSKAQYAVGDTITLQGKNIPSDAVVDVTDGNGDYIASDISASQINGYGIKVDTTTFQASGTNDLEYVVTAADGTQLASGSLIKFTVGSSATGPGTGGPGTGGPGTGGPAAGPTVDCTGSNPDPNHCLINPLPTDSLTSTLLLIMQGFMGVIAAWAVAFIIIGGFRLVMSQGSEEGVTAAKKTITYAVVGLAVAMLAFSIIAILQSVLQAKIPQVTTSTSMRESANPNS